MDPTASPWANRFGFETLLRCSSLPPPAGLPLPSRPRPVSGITFEDRRHRLRADGVVGSSSSGSARGRDARCPSTPPPSPVPTRADAPADTSRRWVEHRDGLTVAQRSSSRRAIAGRKSTSHDLGQDRRVVVLRISCGVHQRERSGACSPAQRGELGAPWSKLLDVAAPELLVASGIVPEPLPQRRARRQVLRPLVELRPLARDASRPESIDQDAVAVGRRGRIVRALHSNVHRRRKDSFPGPGRVERNGSSPPGTRTGRTGRRDLGEPPRRAAEGRLEVPLLSRASSVGRGSRCHALHSSRSASPDPAGSRGQGSEPPAPDPPGSEPDPRTRRASS